MVSSTWMSESRFCASDWNSLSCCCSTALDREIYKCVSGDITTNDVVLTAERIRHIKEHHPEDYERYHEYIRMMIETPDYILETRAPDSAFIVNEFAKGEEHFRMILKLKTPREEKNYLNSVIQFQYINAREYRQLIKNKKILYKRHDL